jgi:hypothetical protein
MQSRRKNNSIQKLGIGAVPRIPCINLQNQKQEKQAKGPAWPGPGGSHTDQGCFLKAEITSFAAYYDMIENFHVKKFTGIDKHCSNLFIG